MTARRRGKPSGWRLRSRWATGDGAAEVAHSIEGESTAELLERGDAAMKRGDADTAARAYVKALDTVAADAPAAQVAIYLRLGRTNQARGRTLACVHCYRKALDIDPRHCNTLRALVALHAEWHEWDAVKAVEQQLFEAIDDDEALQAELLRSGDRWWRAARDPRMALRRYRSARRVDPTSRLVAARLRAFSSANHSQSLSDARRAVVGARDKRARAQALLALGRQCWFESRDKRRAIAAFEEAYRCDPTMLPALQMLVQVLIDLRQWARLNQLCRSVAHTRGPAADAARALMREALKAMPTDHPHSRRIRRRSLRFLDRERRQAG